MIEKGNLMKIFFYIILYVTHWHKFCILNKHKNENGKPQVIVGRKATGLKTFN